ncbi:two pore potassium channel a-like isoform X4 [Nicotiana tomentosiformis]|uniref:two pore potassium channel a-like isoform X4 n=1 Tax=Nicotiana tomentosiformis TaxID=4098 RepID=UPI00388C35F1
MGPPLAVMDKGDVEQPLLRGHVNSSIRFNDINSFKRRRTQSSSSTCIGAICFFIIRHQIEGKKTNGILDAIYLCIVTMTTVGYGDLVPKSILAKLLACIFVFTGMALVGFVLSKAADSFLERQQILFLKAIKMRKNYSSSNEVLKEVETNIEKYKFLSALALLVALTILGTIFLNQVEDLSLFDAFYCVCATITTLGYGDKSFSTKWGRLFASFWILLSTICLGQLFYSLAELYTEQRRKSMFRWVLTRELTNSDLQAADLDHDSEVSLIKIKSIHQRASPIDEDIFFQPGTKQGDHGFEPWKQPLAEMQGKTAYNRPLWSSPSLDPAHSGSLVHRAALYSYSLVHNTFVCMYGIA